MNQCLHCRKRKAVVSLEDVPCRHCFVGQIDSRIRKGIFQAFKKNERVHVPGPLPRYLLEKALYGLPVQYVSHPEIAERIVVPFTADDLAVMFLQQMTDDGLKQKNPREVWLLASVTDQEMLHYSRLVGIPFIPQQKNPRFSGFFLHLAKYPEIKNSLSKNFRALLSWP